MPPQPTFPSEKSNFPDPLTGRTVTRWTCGSSKDQHLYFTSFSVTVDNRWLVFLSERGGHPNLYALSRPEGALRPVSQNGKGLLRSYVYPYGGAHGLSKAGPVLDPARNRLFWIQDNAVWMGVLDEAGAPLRLASLPPGTWSAFTHVSPDGRYVCVPVTDERAFDPAMKSQGEQMRDTVARIRRHGWKSHILLLDTESGRIDTVAEVPFWVTHVQFDPAESGRILFNQEGGSIVRPRIWCLETNGSFRPLYDPDAEKVEWDSHENWDPRGGAVVYHGRIDEQPYLAARTWEGRLLYRHFLPPALDFLHATLTMDGRFLLIDCRDGVLARVDPSSGAVEPLCRHDSSSREQDCHVHPITTPDAASVIFTSDRAGSVDVYEVSLS
ncbi:MAG: hypothetical protein EA425_07945 [Puniceicoccaceae bacterium]|nr:MAG: hypothetical protein EA425_07945 [Puniceicoccaceae bacterium]